MATLAENPLRRLSILFDEFLKTLFPSKAAEHHQIEAIKAIFNENNNLINPQYPDLSMKLVSISLISDLLTVTQWQQLINKVLNDKNLAHKIVKVVDLRGYNILTGFSDPNEAKRRRNVDKREIFRLIILTSIDYYLKSPQQLEQLTNLIKLREQLTPLDTHAMKQL